MKDDRSDVFFKQDMTLTIVRALRYYRKEVIYLKHTHKNNNSLYKYFNEELKRVNRLSQRNIFKTIVK